MNKFSYLDIIAILIIYECLRSIIKAINTKRSILCFFGIHKWKKTTQSKSIDGTIKEYFKCKRCNKKRMWQYNPYQKYICPTCGNEEKDCYCNSC